MAPEEEEGGVRRSLEEREEVLRQGQAVLRERMAALAEREAAAGAWADSAWVREEEQRAEAAAKAALYTQNSELRQANEHLLLATLEAQELREAAVAARRRQEEFLAMLAHELRNPLGPIRNSVEILFRLPETQPAPRPVLAIIRRQVEHMARLLDDLLDVARLTQGKVVLQRGPTEVSECIRRAVETTSEAISVRHQELKLELPDQPLYVDGDAVRLAQVFANLLQNASKYTQDGGVIGLRATGQHGSVAIRVVDNGAGITAKVLPHIFDLFAQDERTMARSRGGLGIGLTIVRRMVELHDGTIAARSDGPGKGSEFIVTLPRIAPEEVAESAPLAVAGLAPVSARVLLIEDNADAGEILLMLLRSSGHQVEVARDGQTGLEFFDQFKPNVVICDIGLPDMDGYEVAMRIKERRPSRSPTMIALTGYGSPRDHERSLAAGFEHHLVKPINPDALLRLIDSAMRVQDRAESGWGSSIRTGSLAEKGSA